MLSLKGLIKKRTKHKYIFLKWKGGEKQKNRARASERFSRQGFQGKQQPENLVKNTSRSLTELRVSGATFKAIRSSKAECPQAIRAEFPHKASNGSESSTSEKGKISNYVLLLTTISAFEQP